MTILGVLVPFHIMALSIVISFLPAWFAAKVVGAGRQEIHWVVLATTLAGGIAVGLFLMSAGWGLLLIPIVYVVVFSLVLDTSLLGALVMFVLSLAFHTMFAKLFGTGSAPV